MFETGKVTDTQFSVCLGLHSYKSRPETDMWIQVVHLRVISENTGRPMSFGGTRKSFGERREMKELKVETVSWVELR